MLTRPQINLSRGTSCPLPLQRQEDTGGEEEPQGVGGTCVFSRAIAQLGCICMCCAVLRHHAFRCHLPFLTHVAISLSSAPTTCPLEASSCARGEPRCKLCTPCPTSCFAREAGSRSCCSGCEVAFLVKNLGLALILASNHRMRARAAHCCKVNASHSKKKSPPHFAQHNSNTRCNKRMVQFTSFKWAGQSTGCPCTASTHARTCVP